MRTLFLFFLIMSSSFSYAEIANVLIYQSKALLGKVPADLFYTQEHLWLKLENDILTIGVTDFAQSAMGDIAYVELPNVGTTLKKDQPAGVVESIKSVTDLYSPANCRVIEVNSEVEQNPERINEKPYESWLFKVKMEDISQARKFLAPKEYEVLIDRK